MPPIPDFVQLAALIAFWSGFGIYFAMQHLVFGTKELPSEIYQKTIISTGILCGFLTPLVIKAGLLISKNK